VFFFVIKTLVQELELLSRYRD